MFGKPDTQTNRFNLFDSAVPHVVHILIGAGTAVLGALAAETAWPLQCLDFLPYAAALGAAAGGVGGWHAGSLFGGTEKPGDRWRFIGASLGGLITGFAFFVMLFLQCKLIDSM